MSGRVGYVGRFVDRDINSPFATSSATESVDSRWVPLCPRGMEQGRRTFGPFQLQLWPLTRETGGRNGMASRGGSYRPGCLSILHGMAWHWQGMLWGRKYERAGMAAGRARVGSLHGSGSDEVTV